MTNYEPQIATQHLAFDIKYVRTPLFDMDGYITNYNVNIIIGDGLAGSFEYYFSDIKGIVVTEYLNNTDIIHLLRSILSCDMGGMEYRIVKDNFVEHFKNEVI